MVHIPLKTPRADSWWAPLTDAELWDLWTLYTPHDDPTDTAKKLPGLPWQKVAEIAQKRLKRDAAIEHGPFYRWVAWMRPQAANDRIVRIKASQLEVQDIAERHNITDETIINALKAAAMDSFMSNDTVEANRLADMAATIQDRLLKQQELALKERAQATKDDALKLAREKFEAAERRENAAKAAVSDAKLTEAERLARLKEIYGI